MIADIQTLAQHDAVILILLSTQTRVGFKYIQKYMYLCANTVGAQIFMGTIFRGLNFCRDKIFAGGGSPRKFNPHDKLFTSIYSTQDRNGAV